jgi:hypothetical protein
MVVSFIVEITIQCQPQPTQYQGQHHPTKPVHALRHGLRPVFLLPSSSNCRAHKSKHLPATGSASAACIVLKLRRTVGLRTNSTSAWANSAASSTGKASGT